MAETPKNYYKAGVILLTALSQLEDDIKHNYENGDIHQRALANIAGLQSDLFSSYIVLLREDEKGPLVGRSVILRSILENQGSILHIKDNEDRADAYLGYVEKIAQQVKNNVEGIKTKDEDLVWSKSKIKQRVSLLNANAGRLYDMLSNFSHGNNVQYFLNTKTLTDAYIKAIDSYFVGLFIGFLAEIGIGLAMADSKRRLVFDAIDQAKIF
jgi:hypothetical protein